MVVERITEDWFLVLYLVASGANQLEGKDARSGPAQGDVLSTTIAG
jgi:hypothetical protein